MNVAQPLPAERSPRAKKHLARLRPDRLPGILPPKLLALLLAAFAFCSPAAPAQTTIHVPTDQPTIQAGINAAQNGDTVLVAPGTYNENIDFKGKGITVTSGATSYTDAATTIINGSTSGPVVSFLKSEPTSAVLNGFTIQGGYLEGVIGYAAGIAVSGSSPTISNNAIQKNIGCGIIVGNLASPLIEGNDIRENRPPEPNEKQLAPYCGVPGYAADAGGGIAVIFASAVMIKNNIIEQNTVLNSLAALHGSGGQGGSAGICVFFTGHVTLLNNVVRDNRGLGGDGFNAPFGAGNGEIDLIQNLFYTDQNALAHADSSVIAEGNTS